MRDRCLACLLFLAIILAGQDILFSDTIEQKDVEPRFDFTIHAGKAVETLKALSYQADIAVMFERGLAAQYRTNAVRGRLTIEEALARMLEGTPLEAVPVSEGKAYGIVRRSEEDVGEPAQQEGGEMANDNSTLQAQMNFEEEQNRNILRKLIRALIASTTVGMATYTSGQEGDAEDDIYTLTPFAVDASEDVGYRATSTLAGTRLRTDLNDVGSAISVFTEELMEDLNAVDNQSLLAYGLGTEVGGPRGNFINPGTGGLENANLVEPQANTRIRGLTSADNTRNYFKSDVPWDGYNTNRIDIQRGPNSILFGLGSPAGIINNTTESAGFKNAGEVRARFDEFGSVRLSADYNHVLIENQLAARVSLLSDNTEFRQDPAFEDDERIYAAITYQPDALNTDSITTQISANYEHGEIEANRPRSLIPLDFVSGFFETGNGFQGADFANGAKFGPSIDYVGNGGQTRNQFEDADYIQSNPFVFQALRRPANGLIIVDAQNPGAGMSFREQGLFGRGSYMIREDGDGNPVVVVNEGYVDPATGEFDPEIDIESIYQPVLSLEMRGKARVANDSGVAFPGFWQDPSFSSPDQFDFFNNLIDGNNKLEQQEFDVLEIQFRNTFLNDRVGYQISYFKQDMELRQDAAMGVEFAPAINVDVGELDSFTTDVNNPVANQFVGRPFIEFNAIQFNRFAGLQETRDREAAQAQAFARLDSRDFMEDNWVSRLIGRHDFTGIVRTRELETFSRRFLSAGWEPDFMRARHGTRVPDNEIPDPGAGARQAELAGAFGSPRADAAFPNDTVRVYLDARGPNLTQIQPFASPRFPDEPVVISGFQAQPVSGFTAEDALEEWMAPDPTEPGGFVPLYQANNPANYTGLTEFGPYRILKATDSEEALEYLTRRLESQSEEIDSTSLVWSGSFWDGMVFGMYGWREDEAEQSALLHEFRHEALSQANQGRTFGPVFDPDSEFRSTSEGSFQSRNWSVKADLGRLLTEATGRDDSWLPFNVSVLFNRGEVQNPQPGRLNFFLEELPAATGTTIDRSIVFSSKDNKYHLRVTKYDTWARDAASGATAPSEVWRIRQVIGWGPQVGAAQIENRTNGWSEDLTPEDLDPARRQQFEASGFDTVLEWGEFVAQEFRDLSSDLFTQFPGMQNLKVDPQWDPATTQERDNLILPLESVFVEDNKSFGWEFDFTAQPTENWNLTFNAAKVEALRSKIFSDQLNNVLDFVIQGMAGPAGSLPFWGPNGQQVRDRIAPLTGALASNRALLNTPTGELREWRFNLVTNYDFKEGALKNFGIGGALRYEDAQVIGFQPILIDPVTGDPVEPGFPGAAVSIDINQPFEDDSRETFDLWLKYRRKLTDTFDWSVQLNVFNVFDDSGTVPLHRNPDGTIGTRGIREGRSWQITNTIEF